METRTWEPPAVLFEAREAMTTGILVAVLAAMPAFSVMAARWADYLEPLPWIAAAGVLTGALLARARMHWALGHLLSLSAGLMCVTLIYANQVSAPSLRESLAAFAGRVLDWLAAAFGGAAGTDNLLFSFTMGLLAWLIGHLGAWGVFRSMSPWWAILPSGSALLLNLSYAQPELLPLVTGHLAVSFLLLITLGVTAQAIRWRSEQVEHSFHQGLAFPVMAAVLGAAIIFGAWRLPVGDVNKSVASAWENVAGPWQALQTTFDRLFASLSPSTVSGRGLSVSQTMAPRGAFELGDKPVIRVAGREPAYWRAVTYDQYTGRVLNSSPPKTQRLDRRQPIEGAIEPDAARKIVEYTITMLAPASSVLYSPEMPLTVSVPSVYEYRGDLHDYGSLKPIVPVREQQRYGVLAAVSTASAAELRQAESNYPAWVQSTYLQLPSGLPDAVRQQSWQVVGAVASPYDRAAAVEQYLRGLTYSTRVPVPPADRDWVSFLIFESREGYCDYFATAMMVMLRTVGVPARVASGYVTGDWDATTQAYLVTERHAHSWTEVYFPRFGWIAFEPSANRPVPPRLDQPIPSLTDEEIARLADLDYSQDSYMDEDELFDSGGPLFLPPTQGSDVLPLPIMVAGGVFGLVAIVVAAGLVWVSGLGRVYPFARPYARVVRLCSLGGLGPRRADTPYEYTEELGRLVPAARSPLEIVAKSYVAGRYGAKEPQQEALLGLTTAGHSAALAITRGLVLQRARDWIAVRLATLTQPERRRSP